MFKTTAVTAEPLTVKQIGVTVWILRLCETAFEHRAVTAVGEAFREAVEREASDIVVDLNRAAKVSAAGVATLTAMAEEMLARNGALWIAAPWSEGAGYTLRPIQEPGTRGLVGLSPVLDLAIADYGDEETVFANLHTALTCT